MKRWAVLTVALYVAALVVLTIPVLVSFFGWGIGTDIPAVYAGWPYWVFIAVPVAGQALLLLAPVARAERRPRARRSVMTTAITAAFFAALLAMAAVSSILMAIWGDDGIDAAVYSSPVVLAFWVWWTWAFRRYAKSTDPDRMHSRAMRWLLGGSILEMLVAVSSHIVTRRRDDCCAPTATFFLFAAGFAIMLLSFGPGVFFLFVERCRRLRPRNRKATEEPSS
jgi:hypothetical protein